MKKILIFLVMAMVLVSGQAFGKEECSGHWEVAQNYTQEDAFLGRPKKRCVPIEQEIKERVKNPLMFKKVENYIYPDDVNYSSKVKVAIFYGDGFKKVKFITDYKINSVMNGATMGENFNVDYGVIAFENKEDSPIFLFKNMKEDKSIGNVDWEYCSDGINTTLATNKGWKHEDGAYKVYKLYGTYISKVLIFKDQKCIYAYLKFYFTEGT
jgi:hypothetical protein